MSLPLYSKLQYFLAICFVLIFSSTATAYPYESSVVGYSPDDLLSIRGITNLFDSWIEKHGKSYMSAEEKSHGFEIFKKNLKYIDERNKVVTSYWLGLNKFSDISSDELKKMYPVRLKVDDQSSTKRNSVPAQEFKPMDLETLPDSVDWRNGGAVTPVKNQYGCDAGWAFSVVAAVEGINQIETGHLESLSEQQLIDCVHPSSFPCSIRTLSRDTFSYIVKSGGLSTEYHYPYKQAGTNCKTHKITNPVTISGYTRVAAKGNEPNFLMALAQQPLTVGVNGYACKDFLFYKGGILNINASLCGTDHDHDITAVGYGTTRKHKQDYFIMKNSWGTDWGEKGYIRMRRHTRNPFGQCGINLDVSYPIKNN